MLLKLGDSYKNPLDFVVTVDRSESRVATSFLAFMNFVSNHQKMCTKSKWLTVASMADCPDTTGNEEVASYSYMAEGLASIAITT